MILNADFHIHSKYSGGTSRNMELPVIAKHAELKGLDLVGTGDALHPGWLKHIRDNFTETEGGIYKTSHSKTQFLITTEVEDSRRVHHMVLMPSVSSAEDLYERFKKYSRDIDKDGRPKLRLEAPAIVDNVYETGGLIGPSHAFTPWTSLYKEHGSIGDCYGDAMKHIRFLELGLSADTYMADRITEISDLTFMTNSDCHSPLPHRLGREFNRINIEGDLSFDRINDAITRKGNNKFILNAGLNPMEGKYHITACTRCYLKFKLNDASRFSFRCPDCRGLIKKGVCDRIEELASYPGPKHPRHRPKYIHIIPLAEVISLSLGIKTITSKKIKEKWDILVENFDTEINVLIDADIDEIKKIDADVGKIIGKFRQGRVRYIAGGGGIYGKPTLDKKEGERYYGLQSSLAEF
ncbi:MAG: TIGR00375 family protein [Candidatus Altiarchaeales archaeon WOR_SM1_86-2]|nr:MAG: TIGR00375 family protein [Candidatus Altiarchaeales archaeon WOR_SM1_86-2]